MVNDEDLKTDSNLDEFESQHDEIDSITHNPANEEKNLKSSKPKNPIGSFFHQKLIRPHPNGPSVGSPETK